MTEDNKRAEEQARAHLESIRQLAGRLKAADDGVVEQAELEAGEYPLSVTVRSGWLEPGQLEQGVYPEEYSILLGSGGPAVQIIGRLGVGDCRPISASIEYCDWRVPWTALPITQEEEEDLLKFARCFYFGAT